MLASDRWRVLSFLLTLGKVNYPSLWWQKVQETHMGQWSNQSNVSKGKAEGCLQFFLLKKKHERANKNQSKANNPPKQNISSRTIQV